MFFFFFFFFFSFFFFWFGPKLGEEEDMGEYLMICRKRRILIDIKK